MKKILALMMGLILIFSIIGCTKKKKEEVVNKEAEQTKVEENQSKKKEVSDAKVIEGDAEAKNAAKNRDNAADTLIVGTGDFSGQFLPFLSDSTFDGNIERLMFDALLSDNEQGEFIPSLAESFDISEDNKTYTFKLREGVKFTDDVELTAKDVAFSYLIACDPGYDGSRSEVVNNLLGYKDYREGEATSVEGIKIIDPYTIAFTFDEARVTNIESFGYGIVPEHFYTFEKGNFSAYRDKQSNNEFLGSGRYKFIKYEPKNFVSLVRNENWFDGEVKVPNLIVKFVSIETLFQELKIGTIDIATRVPANNESKAQIEDIGCLNINAYPENGYSYLGFNLRDERFQDKRVRQALAYGFDREELVDLYFNGYAAVCNTPIAQVSWAYPDDSKLNPYTYDPEKAASLLDEAGWTLGSDGIREKDGKKMIINHYASTPSNFNEVFVTMLIEQWGKIGVKVEPAILDFSGLCDTVYYSGEYDYDTFNMAWGLSNDPDNRTIFHSESDVKGGFNAIGLHDDKVDEFIERGSVEFDKEKRKEIYQEYGTYMNDLLPYFFLVQTEDWDVSNTRVLNLDLSPFCDWVDGIHNIELEK